MATDRVIRLILLGPPGAGKGTQCSLLAKQLGVPHISTGEMMRDACQRQDALGDLVKGYLDTGALVPDAVITRVVQNRLIRSDCGRGFILDGYPRTAAQAKDLQDMADRVGAVTDVIDIEVPEELLIERIVKRGAQGSGRSDDTSEVAKKRLQVYREHTAPVSDFFKKLGILKAVNGVGEVEEVTARLLREL